MIAQAWTIAPASCQGLKSFVESIYTGKTNIDKAEMDQRNILENMIQFNNKFRPRPKKDKEKKRYL